MTSETLRASRRFKRNVGKRQLLAAECDTRFVEKLLEIEKIGREIVEQAEQVAREHGVPLPESVLRFKKRHDHRL